MRWVSEKMSTLRRDTEEGHHRVSGSAQVEASEKQMQGRGRETKTGKGGGTGCRMKFEEAFPTKKCTVLIQKKKGLT